ncbi:hypothetical protein I551_4447 [Mycobacterium ulcerans str. Harvey]|uniref:Uncharacterized protein n=1 Tax=Mycobacterium ulcerans str. Harvey TaxID=1299332 RepID=A0ABP3ACI0_MYCUL|nr:hypothetical protein I551_4447 [Mycobacterium ulcerans str. Harvey]
MVAKAYLPRDLAATADNDAQFMPALAVTSVLVMAALCIGYLCGRRPAQPARAGSGAGAGRHWLAWRSRSLRWLLSAAPGAACGADAIPFPYR